MRTGTMVAVLLLGLTVLAAATGTAEATGVISGWEHVGRFDSGLGEGAAEIVAYDAGTSRLFVVNAAQTSVDIVDISDPAMPELVRHIDATAFGASANSVAVHGGVVAVAIEGANVDDTGRVVLLNSNGDYITDYEAGVLPDMVAFSPNGRYIVVANEGEPSDDYSIDPEGSVTVIDIRRGATTGTVRHADFSSFNARRDELTAAGVRLFGPGATVAQDLEPEYVAVSSDSRTAYVTLQENNAVAVVDLPTASVRDVVALGVKDHSQEQYRLDPSNRDDGIRFRTGNVLGMYMPDSIARITLGGRDYLLTANEGDARDYDGYSEEVRVADLTLDRDAYPNAAEFQDDAVFGRLKTTTATGDVDDDGDFDQVYSYGARSLSIWRPTADGIRLTGDTGALMEVMMARRTPEGFNANDGLMSEFDERSDDKGPEPEAVVGAQIGARSYAFVGLERALGGVMIFDVSIPARPRFVDYILSNDGSGEAGNDVAPEGLVFIPGNESPTGAPLLVASYEVSGTVSIYGIEVTPR